ncbi:prepilin-type N-terminal cleavage/methylation domain-containing protein [Candidatus Kuenenbacteria bacterium]|nr:prepilin-type N-terminal cleavage/methylation domain-containing protein [Candidatus Kuenenbacteria bacterium]
MILSHLQKQKGFTLLEMTIALGIFVVLFTMTLGIYNYSLQAEQRTIQISKLQKEAQFIMEIVAKKIRSGKVNYSFYNNNINQEGVTTLALLDSGGNETVFKFEDNNIKVCITNCSLSGNFFAIPPADVSVSDLKFYITPASNPFADINVAPTQFPKVTIILDLKNIRAGQERHLSIQQTIPQRLAGF